MNWKLGSTHLARPRKDSEADNRSPAVILEDTRFSMTRRPRPSTSERLAAAYAASQEALVAFLQAEIELAFSMLDTAIIQPENRIVAVGHARVSLSVVRQFEGRIQDAKAWRSIHGRADELEAAVNAFS